MEQDDEPTRRSYHHGNLRAALIDAAIRLIGDKGPTGFTFADAARAAGVSPAAPYRHFRDRDALMAEVVRHGFDRFADRLERAWNEGRPNPLRAFEAVGEAYLAFAREERPLFAAMFQYGHSPSDAATGEAGARAFAVLTTAAAALVRHLPPGRRPPVQMMSYHIWAMSHGVAELFINPARRAPLSAEEMLESALAIYLRGLDLIPEDAPGDG